MSLITSFDFISDYFFERFVDKHHNLYIGARDNLWKINAMDGSIDKSLTPILKSLNKGSVIHISYVARLHSLVIVTLFLDFCTFLLNLETLQVKQIGATPLRVQAWHCTVDQDTLQLLVTHSAWGCDVDGVFSVNLKTGLQTSLSTKFERFLMLDGEWISFFPTDVNGILSQSQYTFCNKKTNDLWTVDLPFHAGFHAMHYHKSSKTLLMSDDRTQFVTYHLPTRSISSVTKLDNQKRFEQFFVDDQRSAVFVIYATSKLKPLNKWTTAVDIYCYRNILPHALPNAHQVARWCRLLSPNENQRRFQLLHSIIFNAMGNDDKLLMPQLLSLFSRYSSRNTLHDMNDS